MIILPLILMGYIAIGFVIHFFVVPWLAVWHYNISEGIIVDHIKAKDMETYMYYNNPYYAMLAVIWPLGLPFYALIMLAIIVSKRLNALFRKYMKDGIDGYCKSVYTHAKTRGE
jgi:hypothetical protein